MKCAKTCFFFDALGEVVVGLGDVVDEDADEPLPPRSREVEELLSFIGEESVIKVVMGLRSAEGVD